MHSRCSGTSKPCGPCSPPTIRARPDLRKSAPGSRDAGGLPYHISAGPAEISSAQGMAPASPPAAAAVGEDRVGGHERAGVRAHEQHELADLVGLAEAFHRDVLEETLDQLGRGLR